MTSLAEQSELYVSLSPHIKTLTSGPLSDGNYTNVLRAALAKSYEFNCFISQFEGESFFLIATLRGMCEDIIKLKFIQTFQPADRQQLLQLLLEMETYTALQKQETFFGTERAFQPVLKLGQSQNNLEEMKTKVKDLCRSNNYTNFGFDGLPSVKMMAERQSLLPLYEYLYAATSRLVHCSPHVLLRMGWGDMPCTDMKLNFSTANFKEYYRAFNILYGTYLFVLFFDSFKGDMAFPDEYSAVIEQLRVSIGDWGRWPELVTFEEMNEKPPSPFMYTMLHIAHHASTQA